MHGHHLKQVFRLFEADGNTTVFSTSTAEQLEVPKSFKLFSPFLRELVASQTLSTDNQTLIIFSVATGVGIPTFSRYTDNQANQGGIW